MWHRNGAVCCITQWTHLVLNTLSSTALCVEQAHHTYHQLYVHQLRAIDSSFMPAQASSGCSFVVCSLLRSLSALAASCAAFVVPRRAAGLHKDRGNQITWTLIPFPLQAGQQD
jgi:hypothetical protein